MQSIPVKIRLDEKTVAALDHLGALIQWDRSEVVRFALTQWLRDGHSSDDEKTMTEDPDEFRLLQAALGKVRALSYEPLWVEKESGGRISFTLPDSGGKKELTPKGSKDWVEEAR